MTSTAKAYLLLDKRVYALSVEVIPSKSFAGMTSTSKAYLLLDKHWKLIGWEKDSGLLETVQTFQEHVVSNLFALHGTTQS